MTIKLCHVLVEGFPCRAQTVQPVKNIKVPLVLLMNLYKEVMGHRLHMKPYLHPRHCEQQTVFVQNGCRK